MLLAYGFGLIGCIWLASFVPYILIPCLIYGAIKYAQETRETNRKLEEYRIQRIKEGRPWQSDLEWLKEHPDCV